MQPGRVGARLSFAIIAAFVSWLGLLGGPAEAQAPTPPPDANFCQAAAPGGWEVFGAVSNKGPLNLLCNYKVTRKVRGRTYISGVAIAINYYCNATDGAQAFKSVSGKRDTETLRQASRLVTQEGPKAKNAKNVQKDGITSGLFPGMVFTLQEKEWVLYKPPQAMATIYVETNEKGAVAEPQRFGVADAELVAGDLAPANAPKGSPCTIKGLTLPPGGVKKKGGGGSKTIPALIGVAGLGGTLILVIGKKRYRPKFKKRGKTAKGPNVWDPTVDQQRKAWNEGQKIWDPETKSYRPWVPGDLEEIPEEEPALEGKLPRERVPEQCLTIYDELTKSEEELSWLESSIKESDAKVKQLQLQFDQNRARASIQISIEIGQGVAAITGGLVGAAKSALVTEGGSAAAAVRSGSTGETLEDLMRRRNALASMEGDTAVRNARQMYEYWSNKLASAEADLPKANLARTALDEAKTLEANRSAAISKMASFRDPIIRKINELEGQIEWLHGKAQSALAPLQEQIAEIDQQMKRLEPTIGGRGGLDPQKAARLEYLAERKAGLQTAMSEQFQEASNSSQIRSLQAQVMEERAKLAPTNDAWNDMSKAWEESRVDKGTAFGNLDQLENVTESDVSRLRILKSKAFDELSATTLAAKSNVAAELADIDAKISEIRSQLAKMAATQAQPALPVRVVQTVLGPLVMAWQKAFGAGDTPQEMIDILLKNKEAVLVEQANLIKITSTYQDVKNLVIPAQTTKLQTCLTTYTPTPLKVPNLSAPAAQ